MTQIWSFFDFAIIGGFRFSVWSVQGLGDWIPFNYSWCKWRLFWKEMILQQFWRQLKQKISISGANLAVLILLEITQQRKSGFLISLLLSRQLQDFFTPQNQKFPYGCEFNGPNVTIFFNQNASDSEKTLKISKFSVKLRGFTSISWRLVSKFNVDA